MLLSSYVHVVINSISLVQWIGTGPSRDDMIQIF